MLSPPQHLQTANTSLPNPQPLTQLCLTTLSPPIVGHTHLKFLLLQAGAQNFPHVTSPKRKALPCCPRGIFKSSLCRSILSHAPASSAGQETIQIPAISNFPQCHIPLPLFKVGIYFIRKNNNCGNSKKSVPLTGHSPCTLRPFAFLTQLWPPTSLGNTLCPHLLSDQKKSNPTAEVSEAKGFQSASRESHTSGNVTLTSSPRSFHSSRQLRTVSEQHYCLQQEDKRKQRYRLWMAASVNLFISFPFLLQETMSG